MHDVCSYENMTVSGHQAKKSKDDVCDIYRECVDEWDHDDAGTRTDTNQFNFKTIDNEKHPIRIWNTMCWSKHLENFHESETHQTHKSLNLGLTIGKTRLREFACPFIVEPTLESCVNIPISALTETMTSLSTSTRTKPHLSSELKQCTSELCTEFPNFEKCFTKRPKDLIKLTVCERSAQPNLTCKNKMPKIHRPNCLNGTCNLCGISNVYVQNCHIHSECAEVAKCILWDKAERAGGKTQLEPVEDDVIMK